MYILAKTLMLFKISILNILLLLYKGITIKILFYISELFINGQCPLGDNKNIFQHIGLTVVKSNFRSASLFRPKC